MGSNQTRPHSTGKSMPKIFGNVCSYENFSLRRCQIEVQFECESKMKFLTPPFKICLFLIFTTRPGGALLLFRYHILRYLPNIVKILLGAFYKKYTNNISSQSLVPNLLPSRVWLFFFLLCVFSNFLLLLFFFFRPICSIFHLHQHLLQGNLKSMLSLKLKMHL